MALFLWIGENPNPSQKWCYYGHRIMYRWGKLCLADTLESSSVHILTAESSIVYTCRMLYMQTLFRLPVPVPGLIRIRRHLRGAELPTYAKSAGYNIRGVARVIYSSICTGHACKVALDLRLASSFQLPCTDGHLLSVSEIGIPSYLLPQRTF